MGDENNDTPPTKRFKKAYADLIRDSNDSADQYDLGEHIKVHNVVKTYSRKFKCKD